MERNGLYLYWLEHCQEAGAKRRVPQTFDRLARVYGDEARPYSSFSLLERLFRRVHWLERTVTVPLSVKFALWCHSLVVWPTESRQATARENAYLAHNLLVDLMVESSLINQVSGLLSPLFSGPEGDVFSDLMSSELAPESYLDFLENEEGLAKEFLWACRRLQLHASFLDWYSIRRLQLASFQGGKIFKTQYFLPLEAVAQNHLTRYLKNSN